MPGQWPFTFNLLPLDLPEHFIFFQLLIIHWKSLSVSVRPLIKLSISWRRDGVPVRSGLSDFNRRLTLLSPTISDSGFYECEAELRSSSVPSVSAGAFLHVLGRYKCTHIQINRSQNFICLKLTFVFLCLCLWPSTSAPVLQSLHSLWRNQRSTSLLRWRKWWIFLARQKVNYYQHHHLNCVILYLAWTCVLGDPIISGQS